MGRLKEVVLIEKYSRQDIVDLDLLQKGIVREWRDEEAIADILDNLSLSVGLMSVLGIASVSTGIFSFAAAVASHAFSNTSLKPFLKEGSYGLSELEDFIQRFDDVEAVEVMGAFYEDKDGFRAVQDMSPAQIMRVKIDGEWQASPYVRKPDTFHEEVDPYDVNDDDDEGKAARRGAVRIAYDVDFDRHDNLKVEDFYFGGSVVNGYRHTEYYKFEAPRTGNYDIDFKSDGGKLRLFIFDLENEGDRMVKLTSEGRRENTVEKFHKGDEYLIGIRCYEDEEVEYDLTIEY